MPKKILIVGGGLAGTIVANGLCRHERRTRFRRIYHLDAGASPKHMYQPGLLYVPFGQMRELELFRDQRKVLDLSCALFVDPAKRIDTDKGGLDRVGQEPCLRFSRDRHRLANSPVLPGMAEGAHWFYDLDGARKMRDALRDFQGGKIVVNVNAPHKCPKSAARNHVHAAHPPPRACLIRARSLTRIRSGGCTVSSRWRNGRCPSSNAAVSSRRFSSIPNQSIPSRRPLPPKRG